MDKFVEDLATAPWFRAIVERWPMLGQEVWASPEIMQAEPTLDEARAMLIRDGASRQGAVFGDVPLLPVDPVVLDWLEGRLWNVSASMDLTLPLAIEVLRLNGPGAFPDDEDRWTELMRTLETGVGVYSEYDIQPADLVKAPEMRSVLAIAVSTADLADPARPRRLDVNEMATIVRAAFGPEGNPQVDSIDRYNRERVLADAALRIPMSLDGPKI